MGDSEASHTKDSKVYPVSARSAFLSSRLQDMCDQGRLPALCGTLLERLAADENGYHGRGSGQAAGTTKAADQTWPSGKLTLEEEDLHAALITTKPLELTMALSKEIDAEDLAEEMAKGMVRKHLKT